jgi:DNA polymerase I
MTNYVLENTLTTQAKGQDIVIIWGRDCETRQIKSFAINNIKPTFYISDPEGKEQNCYGAPITKIECKHMGEYYGKKKQYKDRELFNADLPLHVQYQLKKGITYGFNDKMEPVNVPVLMPRCVLYDIEVSIPVHMPIDPELSKYPIVTISVKDLYTGDKKVFTLSDKQVHSLQVCCPSEKDLLESFFKYIKEVDPDIISGWNSLAFDLPYILNRTVVVGASQDGLSRMKGMMVTDADKIPGREHIDGLIFFRHWSRPMGSFPSFGLKYISKHFAGFEYEDFGEKVQTLIAENKWDVLVDYSLNDVDSLDLIYKKANLIYYHENLRSLIGIPYKDTIKATAIVETLLLRHGVKPMPGRKHHSKVDFEGAIVIQPTVGIKKDVIFLDAKSLYPVIIIAFDLSPDIDKMIPKTITYILTEREKYRKLKMDGKATPEDEVTEQSLKYIANSFYGVLGSTFFKLYDPDIASFITKQGREINKKIREAIQNEQI